MRPPALPRNRIGRLFEESGIAIRTVVAASTEKRLDPFALAVHFKIKVVQPDEIEYLPRATYQELTGKYGGSWSAVTLPLSDGWRLCILNPTHNRVRTRATLMEEIAHVALGHSPCKISIDGNGMARRDYNQAIERTAYAVGAAALLPYSALANYVGKNISARWIARRYGVSVKLVEYRIKITMLWPLYKGSLAKAS